jgi:hypothetical protein
MQLPFTPLTWQLGGGVPELELVELLLLLLEVLLELVELLLLEVLLELVELLLELVVLLELELDVLLPVGTQHCSLAGPGQ